MGFYAYLEIENHEELSVRDETNINVGNPIATFLIIFESYVLNGKNSAEYDWFLLFEKQSNFNMRILPKIIYAYDGSISDEEINEYISHRQDTDPISKEKFFSRMKIENKWGNIEEVITAVNEIVRILPTMGEDTFWYVKENTYPAIKSLQSVLQRALSEGGKRVRLHFE